MKTKIFGGFVLVAIALAVAFNISITNQKQDKASMLALSNVEVLAEAEGEAVGCIATWEDETCVYEGIYYSYMRMVYN